jgi:hypothetical protein
VITDNREKAMSWIAAILEAKATKALLEIIPAPVLLVVGIVIGVVGLYGFFAMLRGMFRAYWR